MNLVIGNSAGVFSGLTCQLAWMLVAENPNNELNLQLHTINKTSAWGNHFLDYEPSGRTYLESSSCALLGLRTYSPLINPTLDAPTGPKNGIPEIANAADEAIIDKISASFSLS